MSSDPTVEENREADPQEGSTGALFIEKKIWSAYCKSLSTDVKLINYCFPCIPAGLSFFVFLFTDAAGMFAVAQSLAGLSVAFAAGAIGLVLAAFALFVSFLDEETKVLLSREVDKVSGLSYYKRNLLPFVQFSVNFLILLGVSIFLAVMVSSPDLARYLLGIFRGWDMEGALLLFARFVLTLFVWIIFYMIMEVKSLCWNIYHQAMTSVALTRTLRE